MEINISNTANTLISVRELFMCSLEEAWDYYMHPIFKENVAYEDVKAYIDRKVELGNSIKE